MSGQQLTALQRAERHSDDFGPGRDVSDMVWLADWRAMRLPYCSVYVIAPMDGWPCKIGVSTNPSKRVNTLQTACWKQLHVAWCCFVGTVNAASKLEKQCHSALSDQGKWLHGEWFDMRPDKASELVMFEAVLAGIEYHTELPDGVAKDFVEKLYRARYAEPKGMREKAERDAKWRQRSAFISEDY